MYLYYCVFIVYSLRRILVANFGSRDEDIGLEFD